VHDAYGVLRGVPTCETYNARFMNSDLDDYLEVESNGMQFHPQASRPEAVIHPGLYRRRQGLLDLSTIHGPGFGYRVAEIERTLPEPDLKIELRRGTRSQSCH